MATEPMTNFDLQYLLNVPVLPAERAIGHVNTKFVVCNTHPSWMPDDGHWVAMYFENRSRGIFYDSFGRHPSCLGFEEFMSENCKQ